MTPEDTDLTVYTVAYSGKKFLMIWNGKRNGWEMPGGHVKRGETLEEAAKREFLEEAGFEIEVVSIRDLGECHVCAALLKDKAPCASEMRAGLFSELPDELYFDRREYEDVIPWARSELESKNR